jgi:hypothetical protein
MSKFFKAILPAVALVSLTLSGCGGGMKTETVTGKVTMADGSPAKSGTVVFEQQSSKPISCIGVIQPDGSYSLEVDENTSGAPQGNYKVTVVMTDESGKSLIDAKYNSAESSPLAYTVKAGKNTFDIKLE